MAKTGKSKRPPPKLKRRQYEKALRKLQARLCHLQEWVKHKGLRVILVFEGRDGAGKGGTIRAITERVSPRVFRLVALPAPSDREKVKLPDRSHKGAYDDEASLRGRKFVPEEY